MKIRLEMHVVPNDSMPMDIIIGSDILEHAELTIRQDRVSISKIVGDKDYCNVFLAQMQILSGFRVDVDHIEDRSTRVQIEDLVTSWDMSFSVAKSVHHLRKLRRLCDSLVRVRIGMYKAF